MAQVSYSTITITDVTDGINANIWTTSTAPTTPNYTFMISNLTGSNDEPREGDIILQGVYRYTITSVGSTTVLAGSRQSLQGATGAAGGKWYSGTGITGTSTTAQIFSGSGVTSAVVGDMYLNTSTSNVYQCTTAGNSSTAKWKYVNNIQGDPGDPGASVVSTRELYYLKTNSSSVPQITNSNQITSTDRLNGWTSIVPTFVDSGIYYTCIETTLNSSSNNLIWSTPVENKGLTSSNQKALDAYNTSTARDTEINGLQAQAKYYWWDSNGAHVASGQTTSDSASNINHESPSTYGFNSLMAPGYLKLRYKDIDFAQLATNSLTFYRPATNGSAYVQGKKAMDLTADALTFYKPLAYNSNNDPTAAAVLNSSGLKLSEGGIEAGTKNTIDYIYVWSHDEATNHTLTINNHEASDWRIVAGNKFGVDKGGNLYASSATISGAITATSFTAQDYYGNAYRDRIVVDTDGLTVFDGSGSQATNIQARFGATAQIGLVSGGHATVSSDGLHIWNGSHDVATNEIAKFISSSARIGSENSSHINITSTDISFGDTYGNSLFSVITDGKQGGGTSWDMWCDGVQKEFLITEDAISTLRYVKLNDVNTTDYVRRGQIIEFPSAPSQGTKLTVSYYSYDSSTSNIAFTFGARDESASVGVFSVCEGNGCVASGLYSYASGHRTIASGECSHTEGGFDTEASGDYSHAEGAQTNAIGKCSHAEGGFYVNAYNGTTAEGDSSHAEGYMSHAEGDLSHAEGYWTTAAGDYSHAQNNHTQVNYESQTAIGKYNNNQSNNAFEIGNGNSNAYSNALTVDWNGVLSCRRPNISGAPSAVKNEFASIFDLIYPVGAIYISVNSTDPSYLFGGTWAQIEGRFLLAAGTSEGKTYTVGQTDAGSKDAVVVSHSHEPTDSGYRFMHAHANLSGGDMSGPSGSGRHYPYLGNRSDGAYWGSGTTTASTGVSGTDKNMPPYTVVYMWKRTA